MVFEISIFCWLALLTLCVLLLLRAVAKLAERVKTAEAALSGVKPTLEEHARLANEIRDIRDILEELPMDELQAQAAYEKAYAESLEAINNYSVEVAMGGGERN